MWLRPGDAPAVHTLRTGASREFPASTLPVCRAGSPPPGQTEKEVVAELLLHTLLQDRQEGLGEAVVHEEIMV